MNVYFSAQIFHQKYLSGLGQYGYSLINSLAHEFPEHQYFAWVNSLKGGELPVQQFLDVSVKIHHNRLPNKLVQTPVFHGFNLFPVIEKKDPVEILHYLHPPSALYWGDIKHSVVSVHDLTLLLYPDQHTRKNIKLYQNNLQTILGKVDRIIASSQATKRDLIQHLQISENKIDVVLLSIADSFQRVDDLRIIARVKEKYQITGDYFFFLSTLEPRKNLVRIIEAYHQVLSRREMPTFTLVIGGQKGWLYEDIFEIVKNLQLESKVKFLDYVADEDRAALYSGAYLTLYPSLYEGFGLPVLEALTCGSPVITSNVSSLPEVAGDAALLVNPLSTNEISEAMLKLVKNKDLRSKLINQGFKQAKNFSPSKTARETMAIYEELYAKEKL